MKKVIAILAICGIAFGSDLKFGFAKQSGVPTYSVNLITPVTETSLVDVKYNFGYQFKSKLSNHKTYESYSAGLDFDRHHGKFTYGLGVSDHFIFISGAKAEQLYGDAHLSYAVTKRLSLGVKYEHKFSKVAFCYPLTTLAPKSTLGVSLGWKF